MKSDLGIRHFLLLGAIFGLFASATVSAQSSVVTIGDDSGAIGAAIDLPISLDANNDNISNLDLRIGFDESALNLRAGGVGCGFINTVNTTSSINCSYIAGSGELLILVDPPATFPIPATLEGVLVEIRFEIAASATEGESTDVVFAATTIRDTVGALVTGVTLNEGQIEVLDIAPALSLAPASLSFTAEVGTSSQPQSVTATNSGNAGGLIFDSFSFVDSGFSQNNNCPTSGPGLAEGASCTINITFSPEATGDASTTFNVTTNANAGAVEITATATAGPAAALAITPSTLALGDQLTNVDTAGGVFTVANTGPAGSSASVDSISGLAAPMSVEGGTCVAGSTTLTAGQSCTIEVAFTPTADGDVSQTLTVAGTDTLNDEAVSASATVTGTGISEARFSSTPAPGNVNLGFAGAAGELDTAVSVSNSGNVDLTLTCDISGDTEVFTIGGLGGGGMPLASGSVERGVGAFLTVAGGESETFPVSCSLPDLATYSATLTCDTNDENNAEVSWTFTCSGLEPLPVPTMQTWALILFALLMLLVGGISIRMFRV